MTEQKKQRTIQVKIGSQAARAMTPDQAADYLKMIAGKGCWGTSRELKMTFDNGSTSTVSLPTNNSSTAAATSSTTADRPGLPRSDGLPCSEKEMKALMSMFVEVMGLQMNTDRLNKAKVMVNNKQTTTKQRESALFQFPEDIPPPPGGWPEDLLWPGEEGSSSSVDSIPNLEEIPDDDIPELVQKQQSARVKSQRQAFAPIPPVPGTKEVPNVNGPVTGLAGIVPFEWSALERSAIEDALEQEERIRKDNNSNNASSTMAGSPYAGTAKKKQAATSNSINNKKPPKITPEDATAALKKVEAANQKLAKAVTTWRNRVAMAVTQNELSRLESLLLDSPLPAVAHLQQQAASALSPKQQENSKLSYSHHWEILVPLTVPKNRSSKGHESRMMLTKYLLSEQAPDCMFAIGRNGRSAVHTACLYGDIATLQHVFTEAKKVFSSDVMEDLLLEPCQDSGWTPLHYAAVSGNLQLVETIFAACCDDDTVKILCCATTNATQTWKKGVNKGITPAYLAEAVVSGKVSKVIETHGMALQDIYDHYKITNRTAIDSNVYFHLTGFIYCRLLMVEETSFAELSDISVIEREYKSRVEGTRTSTMSVSVASSTTTIEVHRDNDVDTEDDSSTEEKKKAKKKKKKKKNRALTLENTSKTDLSEQKTPNRGSGRNQNVDVASSDPLISALEGMGFDRQKVLAGIEACGGSSRATADDVVAWIFGSDPGAQEQPPQSNFGEQFSKTKAKEKETPSVHSISKVEAERKNLEAAKHLEEERLAAEKLATKREEQRRRNREWNDRAQARQAMEAQDRVAKASSMKVRSSNPVLATGLTTGLNTGLITGLNTGLRTGVAPTSSLLSGVRGPAVQASTASSSTQTFNAATHKVTRIETNPARREISASAGLAGGLQGQLKADSGIDKALSNDASTVASSLGPTMFEVEITNNDDATVSTMGSFPAVPQLSAPNLVPPGFDSDGIPIFDGLQRETFNPARWDTTQRSASFGDMHVPPHGFSPFAGGPPPGIPESGPLMDRLHSERSQSFCIPSGPRHIPLPATSQRSFSTSAAHYGASGMADMSMRSSESSRMAHTETTTGGFMPGGFSRMQPPRMGATDIGISPGSRDFGSEGSTIPGLMGFGSPINQGVPLDSAIIDSISTSNTGLGVCDLWGDSKAIGASLLDTLLESRTTAESSTGVVPASALFSSTESLQSGAWQNGLSRSQSVSSSCGGTGGQARPGSIW